MWATMWATWLKMGADLYESYCGSILATAALGAAAFMQAAVPDPAMQVKAVIAPMLIAAVGIILSIIGIFTVLHTRGRRHEGTSEGSVARHQSQFGADRGRHVRHTLGASDHQLASSDVRWWWGCSWVLSSDRPRSTIPRRAISLHSGSPNREKTAAKQR